ncbi:diguanylate cyclase (GGDEF)-like protein/PAS domain S-box-containing protein [Pseudorhizobium tarimense]|uniref:Diguanylate cyclase (GGDEF)-like protein/PAS domain S-box-containing protein n=1 Tax=Pseudorhizobium tarimense TaxID=1079109 RepID=A0ABV2HC79_9HYPH|nr:EAL domain-containing protein [Pseudorhizobium tarimense]MCJ8521192.1 EAL domain-containing protein [Pseudorhizobium tarimense]
MLKPLLNRFASRNASRTGAVRLAVAVLFLSLPFALPTLTIIRQLDNQVFDLRSKYAPREASDRFVFAAIDKEALDQVGTWPWPRSIHGDIIDALVAGGAEDIFFDVDFSTPSDAEEDDQLSAALERAGGGVMLPAFEQHQNVQEAEATSISRPIAQFADNAWLVAANVLPGDGGSVRRMDASLLMDGVPLPSASIALSGLQAPEISELPVDFSIRPETVTAVSVADLLRGAVGPRLLNGKSVVVGAYATELKDVLPVPVHGILSGPMLHILAAETLLQDRVPEWLPAWPLGLALVLVLGGAFRWLRRCRVRVATAGAVGIAGVVEAAGFLLQKEWSLLLPSTSFHVILTMALAGLLLDKVGFSNWLAEMASADQRNARRILKRVINDSIDAVIVINAQGMIIEHSRSAATFFGIHRLLRRGKSFRDLAPAALVEALDKAVAGCATDVALQPSHHEELTISRDGENIELEVSFTVSRLEDLTSEGEQASSYVVCVTLRDVTARKTYEAKLRRLSQLDDLTGTLNRRELVHRIGQSTSGGQVIAVAAIDLHRFGTINSTFGRGVGDHLLRGVAKRLMAGARDVSADPDQALVGRLGGDVFCVAVSLADEDQLAGLPAKLLALFGRSFDAATTKIRLEARVGACLASHCVGDASDWVDAAELALDKAKQVGGSGSHIYEPIAAVEQARRMRLEQQMRSALRDEQFFLLYQPQVDLASGRICGCEALIRWRHPELGLVSPVQFIDVAESNGFICELGRWVLMEACSAAASWPSDIPVAVNVSAVQFAKGDLCADVRSALAASGLAPDRLHIEVTESTFLVDPGRLLQELTELRSLGLRTALDDFGTGYSSLSYIARFPFDKIKIDQSFVRGITGKPANQAIVRSVKSLAEGLGMSVVCEGIEEPAEWQMLANLGCEQGQGYLFGKPQTADELLSLEQQLPTALSATG